MTLLRRAEYVALRRLSLVGKIIDLGGVSDASYHALFRGEFSVNVANNEKKALPDVLCDFERPLPIETESYDGALLINVLEHIFEYRAFLAETARIVRPGGRVVVVVPYIFPYHASPEDYHRYSASALRRALALAGFVDVQVMALGTGVCAAAWQLFERLLPGPVQAVLIVARPLVWVADVACTHLARLLGKKYDPADYALGFVAVGTKLQHVA